MNRPLTIRQFISFHKLSVVALSSDYLAALKVREHDAKRGLEGAFGNRRHLRHPILPGRTHSEQRRDSLRLALIALGLTPELPAVS